MKRNFLAVAGSIALLALVQGMPAFGQDAEQEARQLLEQAAEFEKAKKFEEAARVVRKVIKLVPGNDACLAVASHYERLAGDYAEGVEHALQAIKINDKVPAYFVL